MRWFEGDVSAAIAESRRVGALFVVYITGGKDNEEKHMSSLWDGVDVEKDLPWRAVAVRLHEGSDDARLFAQIYPTPAFPITYFIDMNGKPTNVVLFNKVESMDAAKFREALPKLVFPIAGKEAGSGLTRVDGSAPPAAAPAAAAAAPAAPTPAAGDAAAAAPSTSSAQEIAEKIRRAKELVEKKKAAEEEKKRKEELARETQRREDAKEAHRLAEERRNKELLDAAAARRKDKLDSAKERERVKEQIKADKAEREARFRAQQQQSTAAAAAGGEEVDTTAQQQQQRGIAAPTPIASDRCRIQLRFPDGSTALHDFPAGDALASLRQIVAADARVRGSSFRLAQPAPRRIYKEDEMECSFLDLALTPASTLLVLTDSSFSSSPAGRVASAASAAVQPAYNPMTTLVGFVTYLIWTPIQYVLGLVGMGGAAGATRGGASEKKDDPPASTSSASQPATAAAAAAARRRHQGSGSNIHTLGAAADSSAEQSAEDDADGNWNGNSTQYL